MRCFKNHVYHSLSDESFSSLEPLAGSRFLLMVLLLVVFLAACGGNSNDDGTSSGGGSSDTYSLTTTKVGSGTETIQSNPSGIDCGSRCSYDYSQGASVTLSATPSAGSDFTGWEGAECAGTGECVVTVDNAKSVAVRFEPETTAQKKLIVDFN